MGLQGTFPNFVHMFEHLEELSLAADSLSGPLPGESFRKAKNLKRLSVNQHPIGGSLSDALQATQSIVTVDLGWTGLTGPLPEDFSAGSIESFSAPRNSINGTIPALVE